MKKIAIFILSTCSILYSDIDYYQESNNTIVKLQKIDLSKLKLKKVPKKAVSWYKNEEGILLGLKNRFFLSVEDKRQLSQIKNDFNLTEIRKYKNNLYLVETKNKNILYLINDINKRYNRLIAHPNFYKKVIKR